MRLPLCKRVLFYAGAAILLSGASFAAEPLKVGVSIAQSPPGSVVQGTQIRDGLEIAKAMINDQGGVNGRPIELVYEDSQGVPERGRAAVEKLITRDNVIAITGGHQSSVVLAEIDVANRNHTLYINTNGWADAIRAKHYPEVFNPGNYNSRVAMAMAEVIRDLKAKRVVALAENTDYGIGQAKQLAEFLKKEAPGVDYKYETLDRGAKDFMPVILPLRQNPPDVVVNIMLPPAAYILINQLYEQGVAPTKTSWLYDGAGIADYPDFWQNVRDAGKFMLAFGLYHPKMGLTELGQKVAQAYQQQHKQEPNRLIFQAVDSLYLIAEAVKRAGGTDVQAMEKALEGVQLNATRGVIKFSNEKEPAYAYHQWIDIPYVTYQLTEVNQPLSQTKIIQQSGKPAELSELVTPK